MGNFSSTDLHIPHKEWTTDPKERENYSAIERWSRGVKGCFYEIAYTGSQPVAPTTPTTIAYPTGAGNVQTLGTRNGVALLLILTCIPFLTPYTTSLQAIVNFSGGVSSSKVNWVTPKNFGGGAGQMKGDFVVPGGSSITGVTLEHDGSVTTNVFTVFQSIGLGCPFTGAQEP